MSDPGLAVYRAQALLDANRPKEALAAVAGALAREPENPRALCIQALALLALERPNEALDSAVAAVVSDPDGEWGHRIASIALSRVGRHEQSIAAGRRAVELAPNLALTHMRLALSLLDAQPPRLADARAAVSHALSLEPDSPEAMRIAGMVEFRAGRLDDAERHYTRSLSLEPDNAMAVNNLAVVRLRRGRPFDAAVGFAGAAALDPTLDLARRNIDAAVSRVMRTTHWVMIGGLLGSQVTAPFPLGAVIILVYVAALFWWTRRQIPRNLWPYLQRMPIRKPRVGIWLAAGAIAVAVLLAVPLLPRGDDAGVTFAAYLIYLVGAVISRVGPFTSRRSAA